MSKKEHSGENYGDLVLLPWKYTFNTILCERENTLTSLRMKRLSKKSDFLKDAFTIQTKVRYQDILYKDFFFFPFEGQ